MFVLIRREDCKYVARDGAEHSYTSKLEEAKTFPTREAAACQACGNETIRSVDDIMHAGTGSRPIR